jgi:hypothetical protein
MKLVVTVPAEACAITQAESAVVSTDTTAQSANSRPFWVKFDLHFLLPLVLKTFTISLQKRIGHCFWCLDLF